jgi:hypothetical protein
LINLDKFKRIEIDKRLDRISEIKKSMFNSDEELAEIDKLQQEIRDLKGEPHPEHYEDAIIKEVNPDTMPQDQESISQPSIQPVQDGISHQSMSEEELQAKLDIERQEKIQARTKSIEQEKKNDISTEESFGNQEKIPVGVAEEMLKNLRLKEKRLRELLQIEQVKSNIEGLEKKLYETIKEQNYVISKRDEKGLVTINKELYQRKIQELEFELEHTEGFLKRFKIKQKISDIKNAKRFAIMSNGMVKVSGKLASISNTISKAGNELSKLDRLAVPVQDKRKQSKKQNRKQKKRNQKDQEDDPRQADFGFNVENMFGNDSKKGKKDNYFETDFKW